jgi:hypothetical protein
MIARQVRAPPLVLVLVLIVALTAMGVSYGLWSKTLTIEGTVKTGEVNAKWLGAICTEFNSWPNLPSDPEDYGEAEGKEVGSFLVKVNQVDNQILNFSLENAYPSYAVNCEVEFEVTGTIPVIVRGTTIVPGSGLTECELEGDGGNDLTLLCDELTVVFVDNLGSQLHPGQRAASSLRVHVEQSAEPDKTYNFEVMVCMAQWNEGATAGECFTAAQAGP